MSIYNRVFFKLVILLLSGFLTLAQAQGLDFNTPQWAAFTEANDAWKATGRPEIFRDAYDAFLVSIGREPSRYDPVSQTYASPYWSDVEMLNAFTVVANKPSTDWDAMFAAAGIAPQQPPAPSEPSAPPVDPIEQENAALRDAYNQLQNELQGYENLWQQLQLQIENGDEIDWDGIGQQLGIPPTTPDDLLSRLDQLRNYNNILNEYRDNMSDKGLTTVEDLMRWYRGQIPDKDGKYCQNGDQSCQQYDREKINGIKTSPGKEGARMINIGGDGDKSGFVDVSEILSGLQQQIPSLIRLLIAISYITGIIFMIMSVMKLKHIGERAGYYSQHGGLVGALIYAVVGSMLVYFPTMVHVSTNTLMSDGGDFAYAYDFNATDFGYPGLVLTVVAIIRLVGYIAFFRGWLLLVKVGNGQQHQGSMSKGIVHMIGGILAVNIITTWEILRATFGYVW